MQYEKPFAWSDVAITPYHLEFVKGGGRVSRFCVKVIFPMFKPDIAALVPYSSPFSSRPKSREDEWFDDLAAHFRLVNHSVCIISL